jgi:hypothetical protein
MLLNIIPATKHTIRQKNSRRLPEIVRGGLMAIPIGYARGEVSKTAASIRLT